MVLLKYFWNAFDNSWNTIINCEVNIILTWSAYCVIIYTDVVTETNLYVPLVTLSTQDNAKLLPQLELLAWNPNLNHLVETIFQGVNRPFVLAFENDGQRTSNKIYYLPNVEIKDYNAMIDRKNLFE